MENNKLIEQYILQRYQHKEGDSVERDKLHSGHWCCFIAISDMDDISSNCVFK